MVPSSIHPSNSRQWFSNGDVHLLQVPGIYDDNDPGSYNPRVYIPRAPYIFHSCQTPEFPADFVDAYGSYATI